eukprot:7113937-Pyramimonas_sp.AAC.1
MTARARDRGAMDLNSQHAGRVLTGAQSGGSEGYGSGDKTEVLEHFLKDSLSLAKRQVIKDISTSSGFSSRHRHSSLRTQLPPVNEDKPVSAVGDTRWDSRQQALEVRLDFHTLISWLLVGHGGYFVEFVV